jgi:hypothetical protein
VARPRPSVALLGLAALAACDHKERPWDQPDAAPLVTQPPAPVATAAVDAGERASDAGPSADPEAPVLPVRVGGPWVRCYGGFHVSGDPKKDVTRLSLLCGPENGMKKLTRKGGGPVNLDGAVRAGDAPVSDTFAARRGECFRIFAVAEPSVADLDVVVRTSRGTPIAADHGEDAWPIVQPDRPFCALEDDTYTWEITAKRGAGKFAAEVWVLRPR